MPLDHKFQIGWSDSNSSDQVHENLKHMGQHDHNERSLQRCPFSTLRILNLFLLLGLGPEIASNFSLSSTIGTFPFAAFFPSLDYKGQWLGGSQDGAKLRVLAHVDFPLGWKGRFRVGLRDRSLTPRYRLMPRLWSPNRSC